MKDRSLQSLLNLLQAPQPVELADIQSGLGGASRSTVFRYLEKVPYRSSYNHNGRFYTFHDPTRYDHNGLYSVGNIHFSTDGKLLPTVVRLVQQARTGYTQRELQDLLRVRVQVFLLAALRKGDIDRTLLGKSYLYLHHALEVRATQLERRQQLIDQAAGDEYPTDIVVIRVLLVLLRYPGASPGEVARRLMDRSPPISLPQIETVFRRFRIGEKGGPTIF